MSPSYLVLEKNNNNNNNILIIIYVEYNMDKNNKLDDLMIRGKEKA